MPFFKEFRKGERRSSHAELKSDTRQVVDAKAADPAALVMEDEGGATTGEPAVAAEAEATGAENAEGTTAPAADSTASEGETAAERQSEGEEVDSAITVAPSLDDSRMTTTSMVMTSSAGTERRRRHVSKIEAATEYLYGRAEEPWTKPTGLPPVDMPAVIRVNRAQTMRRSCIMKRVKEEAEERSRIEEQDVAWTDNDILDPIVARTVPKAVYGEPKIAIRETKSSKFRFLYNRKPPGVKVYFKLAKEDERKKPPFVAAAPYHCY